MQTFSMFYVRTEFVYAIISCKHSPERSNVGIPAWLELKVYQGVSVAPRTLSFPLTFLYGDSQIFQNP